MPLAKNQVVNITVESLANDGNGVGRYEGEVVFVPGAAAGDVLKVKIVKPAKHYAFGRLEEVITPGQGRQASDCPISHVCGGCSFRHITYGAELAAKQGFVEDALRRIGKIDAAVSPVLPAPAVDRYRNKVQYPVGKDANGELVYGFYASRSHRIVSCSDCLLQPVLLNEIAARTAALLVQMGAQPYDETRCTGLVRHIYLRYGAKSGQVMVCLVLTNARLPQKETLVNALTSEFPSIATIVLNINPHNTNVICGERSTVLYGNGRVADEMAGVPLELDEKSFQQVNSAGAEQLFGVVRGFASPAPADNLLDLYCGAGVIGLSMASVCKSLAGVEVVPQAVEAAKKSAAAMGLSNARFICADAGEAAGLLQQEGYRPDIVTLDPPRKGCGEATLQALTAMAPRKIVMVSCNPATMARDLAYLVQDGYALQKVQPVDMFPRTKHVECVVLLEKTEAITEDWR